MTAASHALRRTGKGLRSAEDFSKLADRTGTVRNQSTWNPASWKFLSVVSTSDNLSSRMTTKLVQSVKENR